MPLTESQIDQFRARLTDLRNVLDAQRGQDDKERLSPPATNRGGSDRGDESFAEMWTHLNIASAVQRVEAYAQVQDALRRIEKGVYGVCAECGKDIGLERLEANPVTHRCLDCQASAEDDRSERDATPSL
ncbi:MAG: TraR/DksA family transcriptional regulator [Gammaproteobacteria bacterium]|nr:TraR/DksA family transcriptional regulator [Gammaproteobacteria bacterium]